MNHINSPTGKLYNPVDFYLHLYLTTKKSKLWHNQEGYFHWM